MLIDKWNKYLPDYLIIDVLENNADAEDFLIFEKLKHLDDNKFRIRELEKVFSSNSEDDKDKFVAEPSLIYDKDKNSITPQPGEIWSTYRIPKFPGENKIEPVAEAKFVYILAGAEAYQSEQVSEELTKHYPEYKTVLALPVSLYPELANEKDLIIPPNNEILGIPFAIETEIEFNAVAANLRSKEGKLDDALNEQLLNLYFKTNGMEYDPGILKNCKTGHAAVNKYSANHQYKLIEFENIKYLEEPVEALEEFFQTDINLSEYFKNNIAEEESVKEYSYAAGEKINPNADPYDTIENFKVDNIELEVLMYKKEFLYFRLITAETGNFHFSVKDKLSGAEILKESIQISEAGVFYIPVNKKIIKSKKRPALLAGLNLKLNGKGILNKNILF